MNRIRKIMQSNVGTAILFAAAAVLLTVSSVGGARAALIYSQDYSSQVEMYDIGVVLMENGREVSWRDYDEERKDGTWDRHRGFLLGGVPGDEIDEEPMLLAEHPKVQLGYPYEEAIQVKNNGTINEYVRVSVYRYWLKQGEDGEWEKDPTLSPDLIDLHFLTGSSGWHIDESSTTSERTVLYYDKLLYAEGDGESVSTPLSDILRVSGRTADFMTMETSEDGNSTVTTYAYNNKLFVLQARVDAVQEHNAEDAVWSAWGRHVNTGDGTMTLAE